MQLNLFFTRKIRSKLSEKLEEINVPSAARFDSFPICTLPEPSDTLIWVLLQSGRNQAWEMSTAE